MNSRRLLTTAHLLGKTDREVTKFIYVRFIDYRLAISDKIEIFDFMLVHPGSARRTIIQVGHTVFANHMLARHHNGLKYLRY